MNDKVFVFLFTSCKAAWSWEGVGQQKEATYEF